MSKLSLFDGLWVGLRVFNTNLIFRFEHWLKWIIGLNPKFVLIYAYVYLLSFLYCFTTPCFLKKTSVQIIIIKAPIEEKAPVCHDH